MPRVRGGFDREKGHGGHSENDWVAAHSTWLEGFRADPSGQLEARFHQILGQYANKAHFGDVRDMTQDVEGGLTLDKFAELSVAMRKPGVDGEAVARQHGLPDMNAWLTGSAAWNAKLQADTTHKLSMQFGTLYQKHAGPEFAQQQLAATAALLAGSNKPRDAVDAPKKDLSQATLLRNLRSGSRDERWEAARWLAHQWKKGDPSTQVNLECVPVLIDVLEHHDEHTANKAADAAEKLTRDLGQYTEAVKWAVNACATRAREKLATQAGGEDQAALKGSLVEDPSGAHRTGPRTVCSGEPNRSASSPPQAAENVRSTLECLARPPPRRTRSQPCPRRGPGRRRRGPCRRRCSRWPSGGAKGLRGVLGR